MKKLILLFVIISGTLFSQQHVGYCKITKVSPDPTKFSKITFKFLTPEGKPALSRVAIKLNNDTVIQPKIEKDGTYVMMRLPGTYTFSFFVKYWHDVNAKPITVKSKTNTFVTVKFDAEEIGGTPH